MGAVVVGKVIDQNTLDWELLRASIDKRQEPSDIELKNPVRVVLVIRFGRTGLKYICSRCLAGDSRIAPERMTMCPLGVSPARAFAFI
jgi:hypothetical protein